MLKLNNSDLCVNGLRDLVEIIIKTRAFEAEFFGLAHLHANDLFIKALRHITLTSAT